MEAGGPLYRLCSACGKMITYPDDYFSTGALTSDPSDPLYTHNMTQLHRQHIRDWKPYDDFRRRVEELQNSAAWKGPELVFDEDPARLHWQTKGRTSENREEGCG